MNRVEHSRTDIAPDALAGAEVLGGVVLGGMISLVLWAGIIGAFVL